MSVFVVGGVLLVYTMAFGGFWVTFLRFCPWWVIESSGEISFSFRGFFFFIFLLYGPQVDPSSSLFLLFACRMAKDHEKVSTSQAGRRRVIDLIFT